MIFNKTFSTRYDCANVRDYGQENWSRLWNTKIKWDETIRYFKKLEDEYNEKKNQNEI